MATNGTYIVRISHADGDAESLFYGVYHRASHSYLEAVDNHPNSTVSLSFRPLGGVSQSIRSNRN